jgi:hypothetical protein
MQRVGDVIPLGRAAELPVSKPARLGRLAGFLDREAFVILALSVCGIFQVLMLRISIKSDAWLTLLAGRLETSSWLPQHDHLAILTAGRDWIDQQWLAHVALYELWNVGGWPLALVAVAAFFLGALAVCAVAARRAGATPLAVGLVAVPTFLIAYPNTILRAQVPAYLLFALLLALLLEDAAGPRRRRVYLVFPLLVLWANVHGSVVLGAGLVAVRGVLFAVERLRAREASGSWLSRALALVLLPWPCLLASPYGPALPSYYRDVLFNSSFGRFVTEWGPSTLQAQPIFYGFALAGLWLVARRGSSATAFSQIVVAGSALAGMAAVRNIVWFALAALAILPRALDDLWKPEEAPRRRGVNVALALTGLGALAISVAVALSRDDDWYTRAYSRVAADRVATAVRDEPSARVFANERYADWLLFEHPELAGKVAYDARFELLTASQLRSIAEFRTQRGPNWARVTKGYRILVLDPVRERSAVRALMRPGVWTMYGDTQVIVLGRTASAAG